MPDQNMWFFETPKNSPAGSDELFGLDGGTPPSCGNSGGRWHVMLTLLCLALTVVVSFLMAWLTRYMPSRGIWLLGLTFAAPAFTVVCSALVLEMATGAMNPSYSRMGQAGVALAVVIACFIVGCFGEVTSGFSRQMVQPTVTPTVVPTPTPTVVPSPTPEPPGVHYLIVLDKSGSMSGNADKQSIASVQSLLEKLPDNTWVGLVLFDEQVIQDIPMRMLTSGVRADLKKALETPPGSTTNFFVALSAAIDLADQAALPSGDLVRIVMVTDGSAEMDYTERSSLQQRLQRRPEISISALYISNAKSTSLSQTVNTTGGMVVDVNSLSDLTKGLITVSLAQYPTSTPVPTPTPTPVPTPPPEPIVIVDVVRETAGDNVFAFDSSLWITSVMLIAQGVIMGIGLTVMLSRQRQRRFQLILSILSGIAAACVTASPLFGAGAAWLREAVAFSTFGLVFMKKNR